VRDTRDATPCKRALLILLSGLVLTSGQMLAQSQGRPPVLRRKAAAAAPDISVKAPTAEKPFFRLGTPFADVIKQFGPPRHCYDALNGDFFLTKPCLAINGVWPRMRHVYSRKTELNEYEIGVSFDTDERVSRLHPTMRLGRMEIKLDRPASMDLLLRDLPEIDAWCMPECQAVGRVTLSEPELLLYAAKVPEEHSWRVSGSYKPSVELKLDSKVAPDTREGWLKAPIKEAMFFVTDVDFDREGPKSGMSYRTWLELGRLDVRRGSDGTSLSVVPRPGGLGGRQRSAPLDRWDAAQTTEGPLNPDTGITTPSVVFRIEPEYTEEARRAKYQGSVLLLVLVDSEGSVREVRVIRSLGLGLDEKAVEAARQWKFKPAMRAGKPVPSTTTIEFSFRLPGK
jgi:TonB family protein